LPLKGKGIITKLQRELLLLISSLPDSQHFHLTGGTALAEYYLGHRRSFDLDLFTWEKDIVLPFGRVAEERLKKEFPLTVVRRFESFAEFEVGPTGESTRLQLAYDSPVRFEEPIDSDTGIRVNAYTDLITDKLLAFFGRAEPRDAVDLFFILKTQDFWELTALASKKDPGFDLYWLAVSLNKTLEFPDELERWPVEMLLPLDTTELKSTFRSLSQQIMERIRERPR
jgi:hypothetical protein